MSGQKSNTYIKFAAVIGLVVLAVASMFTGQNPFDLIISFFIDLMVFLFYCILVLSPLAVLAYIFILCFTNIDSTVRLSTSDLTKMRVASFMQTFKGDGKKTKKAGNKKKNNKKK